MKKILYTIIYFLIISNLFSQDWKDRNELIISDSIWNIVLKNVNTKDNQIGYTFEEMRLYNPDEYQLRNVENQFRDVRSVFRYSGTLTQGLLVNAENPDVLVRTGYGMTDISAGRMLPLPPDSVWGVKWMPENTTLDNAIKYINKLKRETVDMDINEWDKLPAHYKKLIIRIFIGAEESYKWLIKAYDYDFILKATGKNSLSEVSTEELYKLATVLWTDERLGQSATENKYAFELINKIDRSYLDFASVIFFAHVNRALKEFVKSDSAYAESFSTKGLAIQTYLGKISVRGTDNDITEKVNFITIDLGGDDYYSGRQGVPQDLEHPIGLLLDLKGNDNYSETNLQASMGCGLFGIGAVIDLTGEDNYRIRESGLGCGWYGTGLLMDYSGNDIYITDSTWGQGAGHIGAGALIDLKGDDKYTCGSQSQGLGGTLGAGILIDITGNDYYLARDDGAPSELYLGQSVSMSQGVGYGRRADLGDGHSLSGGYGVLVDGAGDDIYHASAWSQGAGYWWGMGILEDYQGNDSYRNGKYSLGAGAHFAIGCQVDLRGNDLYNTANLSAVNQYQGHARDGSIGISVDGGGDDRYYLKSHCAGSGDLSSIGFFWDRKGNDVYDVNYEILGETANGWADTPPMGTITFYTPFYMWRDDINSYGIFIDSGGDDTYNLNGAVGWEGIPSNNFMWKMKRGKRGNGLGWDF